MLLLAVFNTEITSSRTCPALSLALTPLHTQGLPKRLEWIKSLVLHLVSSAAVASDASAAAHISTVLGSVRDSITATQQRCTDSAVNTDLLILQHVVQSKLA